MGCFRIRSPPLISHRVRRGSRHPMLVRTRTLALFLLNLLVPRFSGIYAWQRAGSFCPRLVLPFLLRDCSFFSIDPIASALILYARRPARGPPLSSFFFLSFILFARALLVRAERRARNESCFLIFPRLLFAVSRSRVLFKFSGRHYFISPFHGAPLLCRAVRSLPRASASLSFISRGESE